VTTFLAFTTIGLVAGCIYALTAAGLVVTYTTSGIFNFAHGAIGMVAAFTYWQLTVEWSWPVPLALLAVLLVLAPLFGAVVERLLIRPVQGAAVDLSLVVTLGLLLFLIGLASLLWRPTTARNLPEFFPGQSVQVGALAVKYNQLAIVAVAIVVAISLKLFFSRTRTGIAMRAVVDDPSLAALAGCTPARIQQLSWALGAGLASLAGILLAPLVTLDIFVLTLLVINGYAAALVGRLKSLPLTTVGALVLGLSISYAVGYFPSGGVLSEVQGVIPMLFLFLVLVLLPPSRLRTGGGQAPATPTVPGLRQSVAGAGALVAVAVVLSFVLGPTGLATGGRTFVVALTLLSLVLLTGYSGQVSLCQLTFVGMGAYAMGTWGHGGSVLGVLAAVVLAGAAGALVALPTLRLRGLYLALATYAFANAMDVLFFERRLGERGNLEVDRVSLPGIPTESDSAFFLLTAVVFALAAVGVLALRRGPFGRRATALHDSPAACATLGLDVHRTKLVIFTVSAGLAGLSGALLGGLRGSVGPEDFAALGSALLLLVLRIGGVNTVTGALFGALVVSLFPVLQDSVPGLSNVAYLLTGLAALSVGRDPNGIGGRLSEAGERWRHRRASRGDVPPSLPHQRDREVDLVRT
jgi:branched-chain amino acid transport system permease protein